jgi:hypothetical protein
MHLKPTTCSFYGARQMASRAMGWCDHRMSAVRA